MITFVSYPFWVWLMILSLLLLGARLWGIIGAVLVSIPISLLVHKLDVGIIGSNPEADTSDIIFALGYFLRLMILAVASLLLVILPTIMWRKKQLHLSLVQALFCFRLKANTNQKAQQNDGHPE